MLQGQSLSPPVIAALLTVLNVKRPEDARGLSAGVRRLSDLFTRNREALRSEYLDEDELRRSYLAYFCPITLAKVQAVLAELPHELLSERRGNEPYRFLDVGAGPGSAALGVLDWLCRVPPAGSLHLEAVLVDSSRLALRDAGRLLDAYVAAGETPPIRVSTVRANLERTREWLDGLPGRAAAGSYDLIVAANCLNELYRSHREPCRARTKLVAALLSLLKEDGSLILIEPATRAESRAFHQVRDLVVAQRLCTVYSPCLHEQPCPALARKEDWCHEERPWQPPWFIELVDKEVGFIKDALKFSYLVLRTDGRSITPRAPNVFRVVSELRVMKGEKRAWLCNETGRQEVGRLDRVRSGTNASFDEWHRGAIVMVGEVAHKPAQGGKGVARIPATAPVRLVRPADPSWESVPGVVDDHGVDSGNVESPKGGVA